MSLTAPYKQQNYMGEYAGSGATGDALALAFIQANDWDSNKDGTGTAEIGMVYFNTTDDELRVYTSSGWVELSSGGTPNLSAVLTQGNSAGSSDINMNSQKVTSLAAATIAGDAISYGQSGASLAGLTLTAALAMGGSKITGLGTPTLTDDAATKGYVDSIAQGLDWQESVIDRDLSTPPGTPSTGDRYIVKATGTGAWAGHDNEITEWNGSSWDFTTLSEGMATWVEDEDTLVVWNGTAWVTFGSTLDHALLDNINSSNYYHLTQANHTTLTGTGDASSLHHHDGRYYTETELGSTTSGSEGATLIGTADLGNLGSAANVQLALEATDTHVGTTTGNPHSVTLDQSYDGGANANVVVDAYDVDWQIAGTSYAFKVTSTNDEVSFTGDGAGDLDGVINVQSMDVDTSGAFALDAGGAVSFATTYDNAAAFSIVTNGGTSEIIAITNTQGTANNAVDINAIAGGIDLNAAGKLSMVFASGSTWSMSTSTASPEVLDINVSNAGAGTAALDIDVDDAVTLDSANAGIALTAATTLALDGATVTVNDSTSASTNIVTMYAGSGHFTIATTDTDSGSAGTGDVRISTGDINAGASGGAPGDIEIFAGSGATAGPNGGHVNIQSGSSVSGTAGDVDIDSYAAIELDAVGAVSIDAGGASNFTVDDAGLTLSTTTSGDIAISAAGEISFDDGNRSGSTWSAAIKLSETTSEWDDLETALGSEMSLLAAITAAYNSAGQTDLNEAYNNFTGAATVTLDATGDLTWAAGAGAWSFIYDLSSATGDADGLMIEDTDNSDYFRFLMDNTNSGIAVSAAVHSVAIAAAATVDIDGATGVTIDAAAGYDVALTAASHADGDILLGAHGSVVTLNSTTNAAITGFTDNTIVGALIELEGRVKTNAGNPNSSVSGNEGDICVDTTNDVAYINVDGSSTGWVVIG